MTGIDGISVRVGKVDDEQTQRALDRVARDMRRATGELLAGVGRRVVLPQAQTSAPSAHGISASLVVRSRGNSAYLTTTLRGKLARLVGLLEFGGTITTFIMPIRRRRMRKTGRRPAVMTPAGPRYIVRGPRHYKGKHFMTTAVSERFNEYTAGVRDELLDAFTEAGIDVR